MMTYGPWQEYTPGSDVEDFQRGQQVGAGLVQSHQNIAEARLRQQAMEQSIHQAASRYQAQQQYRDYVDQGGDPSVGMKMYGPLMFGTSAAGMSQFFKPPTSVVGPQGQSEGTYPGPVRVLPAPRPTGGAPAAGQPGTAQSPISIPGARPYIPATAPSSTGNATPITDANGNVVGYGYGKSVHWNPAAKPTASGKVSDIDKLQLADIDKQINSIQSQVVKGALTNQQAVRARIQMETLQKTRQSILARYAGPPSAPPADNRDAITYPAPPSVQPKASSSSNDPLGLFNK